MSKRLSSWRMFKSWLRRYSLSYSNDNRKNSLFTWLISREWDLGRRGTIIYRFHFVSSRLTGTLDSHKPHERVSYATAVKWSESFQAINMKDILRCQRRFSHENTGCRIELTKARIEWICSALCLLARMNRWTAMFLLHDRFRLWRHTANYAALTHSTFDTFGQWNHRREKRKETRIEDLSESVKCGEIFVSFHILAVIVVRASRFTLTRLILHHWWCLFIDLEERERDAFFFGYFRTRSSRWSFVFSWLVAEMDRIICSICCENFSDQRKPLIICAEGHSLCQVCHQSIQSSRSPICPTCRGQWLEEYKYIKYKYKYFVLKKCTWYLDSVGTYEKYFTRH